MTTTRPERVAGSRADLRDAGRDSDGLGPPALGSRGSHAAPRSARMPLVIAFCLLFLLVPAVVVVGGPLRSNGSPSLLLAFLMTGLVVLGFVRGSLRERTVVNVGVVCLLLYFLGELLVYAAAYTRPLDAVDEASALRSLLGLVANVGVGLYVLLNVRTRRQRATVITVLVVGLFLVAVVGLLQGAGAADLRYALKLPGLVLNADLAAPDSRAGFTRVSGTSQHPIEFAVLMSCAIPLTLHLARYGASRGIRRFAVVALVALALAVPASVSRSAVVTLVAGLLVYMFGLRLRALLSAVVALGFALVIYYWAAPRLLGALYALFTGAGQDTSISARTDDYAAVAESFAQHPWLGLGLGARAPVPDGFLDNQWLQAASQGGLVGILAQVLFFGAGYVAMVAGLRRATNNRDRDEVLALGAAFTAIFASGFTFDLLGFKQAGFMSFLLFSLLWTQRRTVLIYGNHHGLGRPGRRWLRL